MVWSHARDRGFAKLSQPLGMVHPKLKAPVWSVLFTATWVIIFGLVFLSSDVALNAILSASVCFLQVSYLIPSQPLCDLRRPLPCRADTDQSLTASKLPSFSGVERSASSSQRTAKGRSRSANLDVRGRSCTSSPLASLTLPPILGCRPDQRICASLCAAHDGGLSIPTSDKSDRK